MLLPTNDREPLEHFISNSCDVGGVKERVDESHSDCEVERDSMKEDMQKEYCTNLERTSKIVGKFQKRNSTRAIIRPNKLNL